MNFLNPHSIEIERFKADTHLYFFHTYFKHKSGKPMYHHAIYRDGFKGSPHGKHSTTLAFSYFVGYNIYLFMVLSTTSCLGKSLTR